MSKIGAFAVLMVIAFSAGCDRRRSNLVPRQLEGVWTTNDPRYQDRFLELSQAFVIIVTGRNDQPSVQLVDHVETTQQGPEMVLTVYSTDHSSGEHYTMKLQFNPDNGGELRFRNQSEVWRRQISEPPSKATAPAKSVTPPHAGQQRHQKSAPTH